MTGHRAYTSDATTGHKTSVGPSRVGIDGIDALRARQSATRRAQMADRVAAVNRSAKRAPVSGDAAAVSFLLYSAVITE